MPLKDVRLTCSEELLRLLFFVFTATFWAIGIVLIALGTHSIISVHDYEKFDVHYVTNVSGILIGTGVFIFIFGFLGCVGACYKKEWMLYLFSIIIVLLFCLEFSIGIYAIMNKGEAFQVLEKSMDHSLEHYLNDTSTKEVWDKVQRKLECCGSTGPSSWYNSLGEGNVTDSCCHSDVEYVGCGTNHTVSIFQDGCVSQIDEVVSENMLVLSLLAIIFGMVHWFGVLAACCLGNVFKEYENIR